ncbi:MAG TPA: TetR/AcrR family transcriptional regulator [Anaerolineales bacterium]|nr:TetR/AcrR family transcriptional regulator [Anaerolineales bacterium]
MAADETPDGPAEPTATKGDQTRQKVLEAAHALFLRQGYHGTSMRQIAAASGLALAGIYNHFADKDALFTAVIDAYHPYRDLVDALTYDAGETKTEFFRNLIARIRGILKRIRTDLVPLAFMDLVEFQGRHLRTVISSITPRLIETLPLVMRKSGKLIVEDVRQVYLILFANIVGFMVVRLILGDRMASLFKGIDEDQWFDLQMEVCLRGLTEPEKLAKPASRTRRPA